MEFLTNTYFSYKRAIPYTYLLFFVYLLSFNSVNAAKPCFTSKDTMGCVPYTVTMDECTNGGNGIIYKFGNTVSQSNTFTFTQPGTYSVTQTIQSSTAEGVNFITRYNYIKVIEAVAPEFEVFLCDNRQVNVRITDQQFPEYIILFGDGDSLITTPNSINLHIYADLSPRIVSVTGRFLSGVCPTTASQTVVPINNLQFEKFFSVLNFSESPDSFRFSVNANPNLKYDFYSGGGNVVKSFIGQSGISQFYLKEVADSTFYLKATNSCGYEYTSLPIILKSLSASLTDSSVILNWPAYPNADLKQYYVYRDDGRWFLEKGVTQNLTYEDLEVRCGKAYCYKLETRLKDSTFYTTEQCVVAATNYEPKPAENVIATFNDNNHLELSWTIPSSSTFEKSIVSKMGSNTVVYRGSKKSYETDRFSNDCYVLSYLDSCGNISEPVFPICPVFLSVNLIGKGLYQISWSPHFPSLNNVSYQLFENETLIYSGADIDFTTMGSDTVNQIKVYKVLALASEGKVQSNIVNLEQEMKVFFPTAFSPNQDGLNDLFSPKTRFVKSFKMAVYNIWGSLVFTTEDLSLPWSGEGQPNGTYTYLAEATDYLGNRKHFKGQVSIVK